VQIEGPPNAPAPLVPRGAKLPEYNTRVNPPLAIEGVQLCDPAPRLTSVAWAHLEDLSHHQGRMSRVEAVTATEIGSL